MRLNDPPNTAIRGGFSSVAFGAATSLDAASKSGCQAASGGRRTTTSSGDIRKICAGRTPSTVRTNQRPLRGRLSASSRGGVSPGVGLRT